MARERVFSAQGKHAITGSEMKDLCDRRSNVLLRGATWR